jgi:plastocyanin
MLGRIIRPALATAVLLAAAAGAPVALAGDPCFHDLERSAPTTERATAIAIEECTFSATVSHVAAGSTVTWRNASSQPHEVVGANLSWGAHDKLLQPGDRMGWTFDQPGVYPYSCMLHPGMTGAIVVGAAGEEPSSGAVTPTGGVPAQGASAELGVAAPAVVGLLVAGSAAIGLLIGARRRRFRLA